MVDTIFTYADAVPAPTSTAEDLVTTTGLDVNGKVLLSATDSGLKLSDDGILTSKTNQITFNNVRDTSLFETTQTIRTLGANTAINLDSASTVILYHDHDTNITFSPAEAGARFFLLLQKMHVPYRFTVVWLGIRNNPRCQFGRKPH